MSVSDLLPYKQDVIRNLGAAIDDPKRVVREEAGKARARWFLM